MPSKIPAPPEAKLTPVIGYALLLLDLDTRERYGGGEATNPTFSAAKQTKNINQNKKIDTFRMDKESTLI